MAFHDHFKLSSHAVIINSNKEVLQVKATYANRNWGLPGGALEPGETFDQAVLRECQEELGVAVKILYLSGIYYHANYNSHAAIFRCEFVSHEPQIKLSSEHDDYRYFPFAELSPVQKIRINDCLTFDGTVKFASF